MPAHLCGDSEGAACDRGQRTLVRGMGAEPGATFLAEETQEKGDGFAVCAEGVRVCWRMRGRWTH